MAALRSGQPGRLSELADDFANLAPSVIRTLGLAVIDLDRGDFAQAADRVRSVELAEITDADHLLGYLYVAALVVAQAVAQGRPEIGRDFRDSIPVLIERAGQETNPLLADELSLTIFGLEVVINHVTDDDVPVADRIAALERLRAQSDEWPAAAVLLPAASTVLGLLRHVSGDLAQAELDLVSAQSAVLPLLSLYGDTTLALIWFNNGDWDEANALADRQLTASLDALLTSSVHQAYAMAALVPACRGEQRVAERLLSRRDAEPVAAMPAAYLRIARAWQGFAEGRPPGSVAGPLGELWASGLVDYVGARPLAVLRVRDLLIAGDLAGAQLAAGQLASDSLAGPVGRYAQAHISGLLAQSEGRLDAADAHFAQARAELDDQLADNPRAGLRLHEVILSEDRVRLALQRRQQVSAALRADLDRGIGLLGRCGARPWRARLVELAARVADPASDVESQPDGYDLLARLTSREREIALLAGQGLANRTIAEQLFVTVRTVEFHMHNLLAKMGLRSRHELARLLPRTSADA